MPQSSRIRDRTSFSTCLQGARDVAAELRGGYESGMPIIVWRVSWTYWRLGFSAVRTDLAMMACWMLVTSMLDPYQTVGKISPLDLSAGL